MRIKKNTNQIPEGFEIAGHEGLVLFILFKMYFRKGKFFFFEIVVQNVCVCVFFLIGFECERRGKKICLTNVSLSFFYSIVLLFQIFIFIFKKILHVK